MVINCGHGTNFKMRISVLIAAAAIVIVLAETPKSQAVGSQSSHWFYQMDRDKSGSVSKTEFVQFMSHGINRPDMRLMSLRFNRLDTNHNGRLERNELQPSAAKWFPDHHR